MVYFFSGNKVTAPPSPKVPVRLFTYTSDYECNYTIRVNILCTLELTLGTNIPSVIAASMAPPQIPALL